MLRSSGGAWGSRLPSGDGWRSWGLPVAGVLMAFHPALPHLPEMGRDLIGFGPLFRGQGAIDSGERLVAHCRYLALQVGFLGAQLVDLLGVVCPRRLEHRQANLFQLLSDGLRGLAHRLKLRVGPGSS